jgi:hypothetical protein
LWDFLLLSYPTCASLDIVFMERQSCVPIGPVLRNRCSYWL